MRVIGLLNWYDEPPLQLAETVASASRLCDHLIAVDGAYAAFPGALKRPFSSTDQSEAILRTAAGAGMGCTIHSSRQPWWGNEVEKRNFMFQLGQTFSQPEDWYLRIDADEVLTHVPPGTKQILKESKYDAAEITIWSRAAYSKTAIHTADEYQEAFRCLFKALPGIKIEYAHYIVTTPDKVLRGRGEVGAEQLLDVRLEHRTYQRSLTRQELKQEYNKLINDFEETN